MADDVTRRKWSGYTRLTLTLHMHVWWYLGVHGNRVISTLGSSIWACVVKWLCTYVGN